MDPSILAALRILSHFWLEEIQPDDLATIAALPELAGTLPQTSEAALTELAVEYQRLFGFNLPPYESIFIDPSAMLQAPATARVQALYHEAGWTLPAQVRVGAPDHVGLELLALADIKAKAETKEELAELAQRLHTAHLALWVPAFVLTLHRLKPHSFYATLANLTLDLLLTTLPPHSQFRPDPFPVQPPPPAYNHDGRLIPLAEREPETGLQGMVRRLLTPCEAGLYLTREDIARLSRALDLPLVMGERSHMLETLFRQAGEYEFVPALLDQLRHLLAEIEAAYQAWAEEYPAWMSYAAAWLRRIETTQVALSTNEQ
jgi:TorA maturation chaperone TorD